MTILLARPDVYTDRPDDIPGLIDDVDAADPDIVVIDLPRGMGSPRRIGYVQNNIIAELEALDYIVEHREILHDDKKRLVVLARVDEQPLRWARTLMSTIQLNY